MVVPPIIVDCPPLVGIPPNLVVVSVPRRGLNIDALDIVSFSLLQNVESFEVRTILKFFLLPEVDLAVKLPALEDLMLERSV
jgi:hypothetical protein